MKFTRDFYYPKTYALAHKDEARGIEIWAGLNAKGKVAALGFQGKRNKPDWHYSFRTVESMTAHIKGWLDGIKARDAMMSERQAKRRAEGRGVEVGDVLRASWGYDQTNIDYYEVTALVGSKMVEIRAIGEESHETAWAQGQSVPMVGNYIGEPMRRMVRNGYVKVDEVRRAYKMEPESTMAGAKVYRSSNWTAYA